MRRDKTQRPSSGGRSAHNSNSATTATASTSSPSTPKSNSHHQGYLEAHLYLTLEPTETRATEPYHVTTSLVEGLQKRLTELDAFSQAVDILEAKKRLLEAEYANVEMDVAREAVRVEETKRALAVLNEEAV